MLIKKRKISAARAKNPKTKQKIASFKKEDRVPKNAFPKKDDKKASMHCVPRLKKNA